jgi:hypothetical protein
MSFTHLNYQVSKPSYMAIKKALYERQPSFFCFNLLCVLLLQQENLFFVLLLEFLIKCQVLLILDC